MVSNNKFEKTQKADLGQETKRQDKFDCVRSRSVNAPNSAAPPAYRLNGTVANESDRGVIIQNGKKNLRILGR